MRFFAWVLVLSIPFYIWGVFWPVHGLPFGLPATVVMIVVPGAVATEFVRREAGAKAPRALWRRAGDVKCVRSARWMAMSLFCMPVVSVLAYVAMRVLRLPLPATLLLPIHKIPAIFAFYAFGALFEEIGWTGYATDPLQRRYGVLGAGLFIGTVWAVWHIVPWWLGQGHAIWWVLGQTLATVAMRVIMVWVYTKGGQSLVLAILFHAMINMSYSLFPNQGSHYNPLVIAAILAMIVSVIAAIDSLWDSKRITGDTKHMSSCR